MKQRYNSQDTIKEILDVSTKLFVEKGYEKTTIKNIVDQLAGLSRGAVYHHFNSKEEIVEGVIDRLVPNAVIIEPIIQQTKLSGLEKIQHVLLDSMLSESRSSYFLLTSSLLNDPKFFLLYTKRVNDELVPYLVDFIEQGNQDGSTDVSHPAQTAEVLILLLNTWFSESLYPNTAETFWDKLLVSKRIFANMGVDILSDSMISELQKKITEKIREKEALDENEK